jgi:peroxiredoxin Q/BCP
MTQILEGAPAPAIDIPAAGGDRATLSGPTVVFFYPKADTPGCTNEALDFTRLAPEFAALGVTVVGISRDPVKKLDKFREKHGLSVILGSDEDGAVTEAYGVWVEKMNYGRTYMGIQRATLLVDAAGVVRKVWPKVSVKGHADAVLAAASEL